MTDNHQINEVIHRIVDTAHPDRIVLFGSAAAGHMTPDSDLDLLVIKSGVKHRRRLAQRIYRNMIGVGVPVDIIVVTPQDVEQFKDAPGTIIQPALKNGRTVYAA